MSDNTRLVIPVEYLLAMHPWTEIVGDKLITPEGDQYPLIALSYHPNIGDKNLWEMEGEWPNPIH